jgi:hypothetical protein
MVGLIKRLNGSHAAAKSTAGSIELIFSGDTFARIISVPALNIEELKFTFCQRMLAGTGFYKEY